MALKSIIQFCRSVHIFKTRCCGLPKIRIQFDFKQIIQNYIISQMFDSKFFI